MANKKISQLTNGGSIQTNDRTVIIRAGANYKALLGTAASSDIADIELIANKSTDSTFADHSDTLYPSQSAVKGALDLKEDITNKVNGEEPAGDIDGSNLDFTLANTPLANTLIVMLNGIIQSDTLDITNSGIMISFVTAPVVGDVIRANYSY